MIQWINRQGVKSDDGFTFQRETRFSCSYKDENKQLSVTAEAGINELIIFLPKQLKWKPPYEDADIHYNVVKTNIIKALEFMDINYKIEI